MYRNHFRHTHFNRNRHRGKGMRNRWQRFGSGWEQEEARGSGPRGRGIGLGRSWDSDAECTDFGPPPWAPRWGWAQKSPEEALSENPFPWERGRWLGNIPDIREEEKRVWLEAQKTRLRAWQEHLRIRLAEIEQALSETETADSVD